MFSKSCEYALQSVLYIALHQDEGLVGLNRISDTLNIPKHFLSKILQRLVKAKILTSTKGPNGGFVLKKNPEKIYLMTIVDIIDGSDIFDKCGIGLKRCNDKDPCPIHFKYKIVKSKIKKLLTEKSLAQHAKDIVKGRSIVSFK